MANIANKAGGSLAGIRSALITCSSPDAAVFTELLDSGKVSAWRTINVSVLQLFGISVDDFPHIGKRLSPFQTAKAIPTATELQDILLADLDSLRKDGVDEPVYLPDPGSVVEGKREGVKTKETQKVEIALLTNITDPAFTSPGLIPRLPSPTLDERCSSGKETLPALLSSSQITCTIMPCKAFLPLAHNSEATTFTTVLSGSMIYTIWPPTVSTLSKLSTAYQNFSVSFNPSALAIASELEGGIAVLQLPGECLRIPPFCLVIGLATSTTVLATYQLVSASSLLSICTKIPFLEHWWTTEISGSSKRSSFGTGLLCYITRIMSCEFETYGLENVQQDLSLLEQPGPLLDLTQNWDNIREDVVSVMSVEDKELLKGSWVALVQRSKGRKCLICGSLMSNKRQTKGHFEKNHWA